jgi:hypothetical protein
MKLTFYLRLGSRFMTDSMQHSSSWEAAGHSASQETFYFLGKLKGHYHVYKCTLLEPILSQNKPVDTLRDPIQYYSTMYG